MNPAIVYGAKSSRDDHGSIPTQLEDGRKLAEADGLTVAGEYTDEAASAYSGDRGPGLAEAKAHAQGLAGQHGQCALIIQHSDRLARGDGIQAAHLVEYALWAIKAGVQLRSVQDPQTFSDLLYTVVTGQRNHEDSARKAASVKDGKRRAREKGRPHGGNRPFGYEFAGHAQGLVVSEAEAMIVRRIYIEFIAGASLLTIARGLVRDGVKAAMGGQWRHNGVKRIVTNPIYIGKVRVKDEVFDGEHEPIIDTETWEKAQALVAALGSRPGRGRGRRPAGAHLFTGGLLRCECGEAMVPRTLANDHYFCNGRVQLGPDWCDNISVRRSDIDMAVYNYFEQVGLDIETTRRVLAEATSRKLGEAAALREDAEREAQLAAVRLARLERDYMDGAIDAADWKKFSGRLKDELAAATAQAEVLAASEADLSKHAATVDAEHDALIQLARIRKAIAGDIREAEGVDAVRSALTRLFDAFVLHRTVPERVHVELVGTDYWIEPVVQADAIEGHSPSGRPVIHLETLDLAAGQMTSRLGSCSLKA